MMAKCNDILLVLQRVCQDCPEHVAVAEGEATVTYHLLWQQARRVADYVKAHGGDSPFVGLNLPKSAAYIVSMIGCWMAGKAFVPIGTDLPQARRSYIVDHAEMGLCLDEDTFGEAMACPPTTTVAACQPQAPAYMIYSSGTTGSPKGILVGHAGLCNLARCQQRGFAVDSRSRYLFFLSVNFDASVSDILVTLTSGATLVIEQTSQEELASMLFEVMAKRRVTHTDIPPSLLRVLNPEHCPDSLQTIVIGGEPCDIDTVRRWSQRLRLVNVYGPTEATVCTSMCLCAPQWSAPLLGDVLDETHYNVYADGRLDAADGELWISGIGLAIGYYKDEELTRKKFVVVDGVRYYRTSDHVRMNSDRKLVFVGRMDRQVKYHGQLVELEEIEHCLRGERDVRNVAVVKRCIGLNGLARTEGKEAIVAYVELTNDDVSREEVEKRLRQRCRHQLPKWMMPALIEFVGRMPQTPSGKTDLRALSMFPCGRATGRSGECCRYASKEEEAIARVMADILKLPFMAADDDFLLCGGDSLDTIILISRLQQMGIVITADELRRASTPASLARDVKQGIGLNGLARTEGEECIGLNGLARTEGIGLNGLTRTKGKGARGVPMCMHSSELEGLWQRVAPGGQTVGRSVQTGELLITGATGFLGSHLLCELLERGLKVTCLVRCSSEAVGMERIQGAFNRYRLDARRLKTLKVVSGDIAQSCLGLPVDEYNRLAEEVTDVVHCAATVNMLADYDELKDVNVTGTRNVMDFCLTGVRKRMHYASTLSVFVSTDRNTGVAYESDDLSTPTNVYGGYGQTKFVAEKMVLGGGLFPAGEPMGAAEGEGFIYRFGLLCGDAEWGIPALKDFLGMFFRGARAVGMLPYDTTGTMAVDVTPVDQASRIVADIMGTGRPGVYQIASENPLNYNRLCRLMEDEGVISDIVDYDEWQKAVSGFSGNADVQALRMALCRMDEALFRQMRYMDLFQTTGIRFDMTNTHSTTRQRCYCDDELIKLYIRQSYETV